MHGRTFNANIQGLIATVWGESPSRGKVGVIIAKEGHARKGHGRIKLRLTDGLEVLEPYETVALGDNSLAAMRRRAQRRRDERKHKRKG